MEILERKCLKLENVLKSLHPDLEISTILQDEALGDMPQGQTRAMDDDNEFITDGSRDYLEWHEDVQSLTRPSEPLDGTACFDFSDAGYIGKSAGASILGIIHKLLDINLDSISMPVQIPDEASGDSHKLAIDRAEKQLAMTAVRDSLVDSYFSTYNAFYPILHERTFRDQYRNLASIPDSAHFHMLLRMVLALGSLSASKVATSEDYCFYLSARSRLSADMLESGTIEQIQILLLMSNYLQKRDKPNTGYNLLGLAVRMAIGMGLHKELIKDSDPTKNTVRFEFRRRLWWVLYLFDSGASITFGRPPIMADRIVDVKVPLNIDDTNMLASDTVPLPSPRATPYTAVISFAKLSTISCRMFERFFLRHRRITTSLEMAEHMHLVECFDKQLAQWRHDLPFDFYSDSCPEWFKGPRAVALWREQNIRTLMYKGIFEAAIHGTHPGIVPHDYIQKCLGVAFSTVSSIGAYVEGNPDNLWWGVTWYATYYLFQANLFLILVILICYKNENAGNKDSTHRTLAECFKALEESTEYFTKLQRSNPVAGKCIVTIQRIDSIIRQRVNAPSTKVAENSVKIDAVQPTPPPEDTVSSLFSEPADLFSFEADMTFFDELNNPQKLFNAMDSFM